MKKYKLWTEGYRATGESSGAIYHGEFKGKTFKEAVIAFKASLTDKHSISCVDIENLSFWGCRFFDSEVKARKSFG